MLFLAEQGYFKFGNAYFSKDITILKFLELKLFATFKRQFAKCGKWQMGWTMLLYIYSAVSILMSKTELSAINAGTNIVW